jgi:hypothetical protein
MCREEERRLDEECEFVAEQLLAVVFKIVQVGARDGADEEQTITRKKL